MFEVHQHDGVFVCLLVGKPKGLTKVGFRKRTVDQRGGVVEFFENRVDDIARFGIDQEDIVVAEFLQVTANRRVISLVKRGVLRFVVDWCVQQVLGTQRVIVGRNECVLKCNRVGIQLIEILHGVGISVGVFFLVLRCEVAGVVFLELLAKGCDVVVRDLALLAILAKAGLELTHGIDHHLIFGEGQNLIVDGAEVLLDCRLLLITNSAQFGSDFGFHRLSG